MVKVAGRARLDLEAEWQTSLPVIDAMVAAYPNWAHQELDDALGNEQGSYLCFREDKPSETSLTALPPRTESIRTQLIFPESAQFAAGAPRPDSSDNDFCRSCHTADGVLGLGLDALSENGIKLEDDLRRQPSQPPMRVGGVIPAHWLGPGLPPAAIIAPKEGFPIDYLVHPPSGP